MGRLDQLLLLALAASAVTAGDAPRPRGVGPELAKHYKDAETFTCILNPTIKLSAAQINDDYCDCPDGSDEPGTAACAHLAYHSPRLASHRGSSEHNTTLALPGFYCKNKGHVPAYLPLSSVNDGACDYDVCCDGSDEYARVGGVSCPDRCKELGKEFRRLEDERQRAMSAALQKRAELVKDAARLLKEQEDKAVDMEAQILASEVKVADLAAALADAERVARGRVVRAPASAGRTAVLAGLAKARVDELRGALAQARDERDVALSTLADLEAIMTTFKEEYNPNFNDEGVKRAVRAWEDYAARDKPAAGAISDADLAELARPDGETGVIDWADWEREEEGDDDTDLLYQFEAYLPAAAREWVDAKLRAARLFLIESGVIAGTGAGADGAEDPAVAQARSELVAAEGTLTSQRNELKAAQEDVAADCGPDGVFRALRDSCVSREVGEYTYEVCFMGQAKQKPKKGGAETGMGRFVRWDRVRTDDDLPADGRGVGRGDRLAMRFENGQTCWNGPARSTTVILACAAEPEIWRVVEEEKCVYRMDVGTPAACERRPASAAAGAAADVKDEL